MKKIFLILLTLLLPVTIFCNKMANKKTILKKELLQKNNDSDKEKEAELLIAKIFEQKKLTLKDIPQSLFHEFEFRKNKLVGELIKISMQNLDAQSLIEKSKKIAVDFFGAFADRIKYIQISDWGQQVLEAIQEYQSKNKPCTNCSSINVDCNKAYLLKNMPKR